jgi:lysozyme family protein
MVVAGNIAGDGGGYAGFGYASFGARVRAKRVPPSRAVKGLQSALRLLAKATRDKRLLVGTDGRVGAKTAAAVNIAFTRHIGPGQAPAALRTGRLTANDIGKNAQTLGVFVLTEVKRRRAAAVRRPPVVARRPRGRMRPGTVIPGPRMGPTPGPGPAAETMTPPEFAPEAEAPPTAETMTPPEFAPEEAPSEAPAEETAVAEEAPSEAPAEEAPSEEAAAEEAPAEGGGEEAPAEESAETAGAVGDMSTGNKVVLAGTILGLSTAVGVGLWQMSRG